MILQCCSPADVGDVRGARAPCRRLGGLVGASRGTRASAPKPSTWIQALVLHRRAFLNALQHFCAHISIARHAQPHPAHKQFWFADQSSIQHKPEQSKHVQKVRQLVGERLGAVPKALGEFCLAEVDLFNCLQISDQQKHMVSARTKPAHPFVLSKGKPRDRNKPMLAAD